MGREPTPTPARAAEEARWQGWMTRAQDGDREAYASLLEELYPVVEAYLHRILGDSPAVDDCTQECLTALHRARQSYDPRRRFRPWLMTIVRHKAIDVLRRDTARREDPLEEVEASLSSAPVPAEAQLDAHSLLQRLPEPYRAAIVMTKLRGHSMEEAAKLAGVSPTAMKTRVHRAMRKLGRVWEDGDGGPLPPGPSPLRTGDADG